MKSFRILGLFFGIGLLVVTGCGKPSPEASLRDGVEALRQDRYRRAERRLRVAAAEKPESATAVAHFAVAQWKSGALPGAIAAMRRAVSLAPDDEHFTEYLGLLLLEAGEDRAALEVLTEAAARHPDSSRLATAVAVARWRLGDAETAGDLLDRVRERDPDYPAAVYNMALFQRDEMQDTRRARQLFEHYLTLESGIGRENDARRALAQLDKERDRRLQRDDPPFPSAGDVPRSPFESSSPRQINRANAAMHRGDLDEAYIHLQAAIRNDPDDAHALWVLGEFVEDHLRVEERAARVWQDFVNRFPDDPRAGEARQRLRRLTAGDPAEVAHFPPREDTDTLRLGFNREPRRDPEGARREFQRGMQYQADRDMERAIFHFTRAIEKDDSLINAYIQLARAYEADGDPHLAADACRYALRLRPDLSATRLQLARLLLRQGLRSPALAQLETVLRQAPETAEAHLLTGMLLRADPERREQARYHLEQYLALEPAGEHARRTRDWLRSGGH